ncbi:MAG: hypothetical protein ISS48_00445 [Candidatus Aenigmarchaeota archaeon]|nr:hypothetical protein [Candidatus Aenigmarchaeota archaeon]
MKLKNLHLFNNKIKDEEMSLVNSKSKRQDFSSRTENKFSENELTKDLAYLAGILRDGSLPKPYNNQYEIQISQDNIEWLENVKVMLKRLFPEKDLKIVKYGNQTPRIKIYSKEIYHYLVKLFEYPGTQTKWKIPSFVINGSSDIKKRFIEGFFEAEGEVPLSKQNNKYKIWIRFHHSWDGDKCIVLEQMKMMLENNFGVKCGNITGPKKEKKFPSFDLAIYGNNVYEFFKEMKIFHPKHNKRLRIMMRKDTATQSLAD